MLVDQLGRLHELRDSGALTDTEFSEAKRKLLAEKDVGAPLSRRRRKTVFALAAIALTGVGVATAVAASTGGGDPGGGDPGYSNVENGYDPAGGDGGDPLACAQARAYREQAAEIVVPQQIILQGPDPARERQRLQSLAIAADAACRGDGLGD